MKGKTISLIKEQLSMKDLRRSFSFITPLIMKQWKAYLAIVIILGVNIYLTIAFARFFGEITDAAIHGQYHQILSYLPFGTFLILLSITANVSNTYYSTVATNAVKMDLKNHLLHHILKLPAEYTSSYRSGELMSHFSNDIHSVDGVIGSNLVSIIRLPIIYTSVFIYLVHINVTLCLVSLIVAPIAAIAGLRFGWLLRKNGRSIHSLVGNINSLLVETFHGLHVIRSFTLEGKQYSKYVRQNKELFQLEMSNAKLQYWYNAGGEIIGSITVVITLFIGAIFISKEIISVGSLLTFLNLINHLFYPLTGIAGIWAGFQRSIAGLERVIDVLEKPTAVKTLPSFVTPIKINETIEFNNITFRYDSSKNVFENLNLEIPFGKVVALVGPSGAGKTTLINLLQGFYLPESGDIRISGKSIKELSLAKLRSSIAIVPQETYLFSGTVKENLLIARPNITENEMVKAAIQAEIHDFILSLPKKYDTEIGENGVKLSGGQKQRVAIARAILKDAPILLLDEATSALDGETEYCIKEELKELMLDRTTIIIAHRLSTIQHADVIMVMEHGKIVQQGTHNELIKQIGLYRNLYQSFLSTENKRTVPIMANS